MINSRNDSRKILRKERVSNGLCMYCGLVPPKPGVKGCGPCSASKVEATKRYVKKHPTIQSDYRRKIRQDVIQKYGGKCRCCGEETFEFLALDHINNDGGQERKELFGSQKGHSHRFYLMLRKGSLRDDLRVLCHNCNMARSSYGRCPHEQQTEDEGPPSGLQPCSS